MDRKPQQTIESAIRSDTGAVVLASDLLLMDEKAFTELRRATWPTTKRLDLPGPTLTFRCTLCGAPLSLTRLHRGGATINRFFSHREAADENCPWLHRSRLRPDQVEALSFFRLHEGDLHRRLKQLIANAVRQDPVTEAGSVIEDRFQIGKILLGERKRPDVRAIWRGRSVVFEMQLYHTAVSQVVKRHYFYKAEGSFLIWVFKERNPDRAAVLDEAFHNRRNLFVLDEEAQAASIERNCLMLKCHYIRPALDELSGGIVENEESQLVSLDELTFPDGGSQPYFVDCDALLEDVEAQLEKLQERQRQQEIQRKQELLTRQRQFQDIGPRAPPVVGVVHRSLPTFSSVSAPRSTSEQSVPPAASLRTVEHPNLHWTERVDRDKARKIGERYLITHPETEWRRVFADAIQASHKGESVDAMVDACAAATGARAGDIRNFLTSTTLASVKKDPKG